jgi:hypothetical protein
VYPGKVSGEIVFLGYGLSAESLEWDDYGDLDLEGKIAVLLDAQLPEDHVLKRNMNKRLLLRRYAAARERGAVEKYKLN